MMPPVFFRASTWAAAVLSAWLGTCGAATPRAPQTDAPDCSREAAAACLVAMQLPGGAGQLHYYSSRPLGATAQPGPRSALIVMHGHSRDAGHSFRAGLLAAERAGRLGQTLVIAPLFQVPASRSARCQTPGTPQAQPGDALWSCGSWPAGLASAGEHGVSSIAALDALLAELKRQWPDLQEATLAGFSAGAQLVQRSIGFAAQPPAGLRLRYVVADPSSWLYFDPVRPQPQVQGQPADWQACSVDAQGQTPCSFAFAAPTGKEACRGYDDWKYGTGALPAILGSSAQQARQRYAEADVAYLEGALDSGSARGTAYRVLDKSCAAMLQGPFRLQRGLAYLAYEQAVLHPARPRTLAVVPGCAHDVACVLPHAAARAAVFPR
mgnify:CR=1 FL=1